MKQKNKKTNSAMPWKIVSAVLAVALIAVSCTWAITAANQPAVQPASDAAATQAVSETSDPETEADALSLWTENAPLKTELTAYIKAVTDEASADFIPVENRIAVFDMDGTLCCETDPGYMLCCDDTERENGNIEKADKMRASCEENSYTAVSMKNDWTTIYGDGVTRK